MIKVKIEADSITSAGKRITTFVLEYPRFIHSEIMTHRVFSRNASSSRAIPLTRMIKLIEEKIAYPIEFRKNKSGMQAGEPLDEQGQVKARAFWKGACDMIIRQVKLINKIVPEGVHKQYVNRLLEPFTHISVVLTATDFDNFFALRYHHMAQPEIEQLAKEMYKARNASKPTLLKDGEWHLPFVSDTDKLVYPFEVNLRKSVACCARVSYKKHDGGTPTDEDNKKLYDRLLSEQPLHASPAEHQAMAVGDPNVRSGNFQGWIQYRQTLKGHTVERFEK